MDTQGLSVSSATIRNDMKSLEKTGHITKPYTSAGRVPSQQGYRYFADWMLEVGEITHHESFAVMESYEFRQQEIESLLNRTALLLASLTGLLGFVLTPKLEATQLKHISLVKVDPETVLAVVVSDLGLVESRFIPANLSDDQLNEINALLQSQLQGLTLEQIRVQVNQFFETESGDWVNPHIRSAFTLLREIIDLRTAQRLSTEGVINLLRKVFDDPSGEAKARELLSALEDQSGLTSELMGVNAGDQVKALIGTENNLDALQDYTLIFMGYGYSGVLGVLGPMRMDYSRCFSATQYVGNRLRTILTLSEKAQEVH
jgi:heat-inducible transcriptional repressor